MVSSAFAAELERNRERFNALFAVARRAHPGLDGPAFLEFLRDRLDPVVSGAAERTPERLGEAVPLLYEAALHLHARGVAGRFPQAVEAWLQVLSGLPPPLLADPLVVGGTANAAAGIAAVPGARPEQWARELRAAAPFCAGREELLAAGQVLAWRAGLAHYREGALDRLAGLPEPLAFRLLGLDPAPGTPRSLPALLDRLRADPWLSPQAAAAEGASTRSLRIAHRIGGFRGFGGVLGSVPQLAAEDGLLLLVEPEGAWLVTADLYGATLHPTAGPSGSGAAAPDGFSLAPDGTVDAPGVERACFPELAGAVCWLGVGPTLAVVPRDSYRVLLLAAAAAI